MKKKLVRYDNKSDILEIEFSINKDEAKKRTLQIQLQEKNWKNALTEEIKKIIWRKQDKQNYFKKLL